MSSPFHHIHGDPAVPLFLFGDHASKHIPARYAALGLTGDDLTRHIAWDIGTEAVTRGVCQRFGNPALVAGFSRLLIDPNRSLDMETLIPLDSDGSSIPGNLDLDAAAQAERIETLYKPYHAALSDTLDQLGQPFVVSVHSFTPKPKTGEARPVDLGLLVKHDVKSAETFKARINDLAPQFRVAMNEPYSAYDLNHTVDTHIAPRGLSHLAIEIRQDHISTDQGVAKWVSLLGNALEPMIG